MKVALMGTCNNSQWREIIKPLLKIDYFDPVVTGEWTEAHQREEIYQRKTCDFVLYCITPRMVGVYSIAEVVDDSNKRPEKTIFVPLRDDNKMTFDGKQWHSLEAVAEMVARNGARVFYALESAAMYMNDRKD